MRHGRRRLTGLEGLENRALLAADAASFFAELRTTDATGDLVVPLAINEQDFSIGNDSVILGLQLSWLGSEIGNGAPPTVVGITDAQGSAVDVLYESSRQAINENKSISVVGLTFGDYQIQVDGGLANRAFELSYFLAGDVDHDGAVTSQELRDIRRTPLLGSTAANDSYQLGADINRDGLISARDYALARRNVGSKVFAPTPLSLNVDTTLQPDMPNYFHPETGEPDPDRPVAKLRGPQGETVDFVANELMVMTNDEATLQSFLDRWNGTLLGTSDLRDAGVSEATAIHTVRVDTSLATDDPQSLVDLLLARDPSASGELAVSGSQGVRLLHMATTAAAGGLEIGVNFIGQGDHFQDLVSTESGAGGTIDGGYSRNAFNWDHLRAGSNQDIGVPEAWKALEAAGQLHRTVNLAVLDMGFVASADDAPGAVNHSTVPFASPLNTSNLIGCNGGPCPWHGTNVLSTAAAMPDNGLGSAGTAGPVVNPIRIFTLYDFVTSIASVTLAKAVGADIINMSYSAEIPGVFGFVNRPFEHTTALVRATGTLIFASAGNSGDDVDDDVEFLGLSFETVDHSPIENPGVIGVGGLIAGDTIRHPNSNYGHEDVDIFAPYTVYVGPDPSRTGDFVRTVNGTSFASPYAAGVAALIWAANPALNASDVETILTQTARAGRTIVAPEVPEDFVPKYVHAAGAVDRALTERGEFAPYVEPLTEIDGRSYPRGVSVPLQVLVADYEDETSALSVRWFSHRSAVAIASGDDTAIHNLDYGNHNIRVTVTDTSGRSTTVSLGTITITNSAPTVAISSPVDNVTVFETTDVVFRAQTSDFNELENGGILAGTQIRWESNLQGVLGTGAELTRRLIVGTHTITLIGTDSQGLSDSDTITVVVEPTETIPPTVRIVSPTGSPHLYVDQFDPVRQQWYINVFLQSSITDDQPIIPGNRQWFTNRGDVQAPFLSAEANPLVRLYHKPGTVTTDHQIILAYTDADGNSVTDSIVIRLELLI
ncbi:MAG: S8 family serine peptidase [Pirellulaceae bacterium]|nr:S8 family serine peptidase [Planctomycetales bacterium]